MTPGSSCCPAHPFKLTVLRKHSDYPLLTLRCCCCLQVHLCPPPTPNLLNQQKSIHPVFIGMQIRPDLLQKNRKSHTEKRCSSIVETSTVALYLLFCQFPFSWRQGWMLFKIGFSFSRKSPFPSPVDRKFLVCWLGWYLARNPQNLFLAQWMQSEKFQIADCGRKHLRALDAQIV